MYIFTTQFKTKHIITVFFSQSIKGNREECGTSRRKKYMGIQIMYLSCNIFTCRDNAPKRSDITLVIQVQGTLYKEEGREDSSIQFTSSHILSI
jgi:hypothetical protein